MKGLMKSMLQHACAGGGKCAVWQVVQHSIMSGDKDGIDDIIEFVKEYPDFWPEEFRSRILKIKEQDNALLNKYAKETHLYERLDWQQKQEAKLTLRREYEKEHRDHGVPPEYNHIYLDDPEPRPS